MKSKDSCLTEEIDNLVTYLGNLGLSGATTAKNVLKDADDSAAYDGLKGPARRTLLLAELRETRKYINQAISKLRSAGGK